MKKINFILAITFCIGILLSPLITTKAEESVEEYIFEENNDGNSDIMHISVETLGENHYVTYVTPAINEEDSNNGEYKEYIFDESNDVNPDIMHISVETLEENHHVTYVTCVIIPVMTKEDLNNREYKEYIFEENNNAISNESAEYLSQNELDISESFIQSECYSVELLDESGKYLGEVAILAQFTVADGSSVTFLHAAANNNMISAYDLTTKITYRNTAYYSEVQYLHSIYRNGTLIGTVLNSITCDIYGDVTWY